MVSASESSATRYLQYIVCVQESTTGQDDYLGPFRTHQGATRVAVRLRRDAAAADIDLSVVVEPIRSGRDIEAYRDDLLRGRDES